MFEKLREFVSSKLNRSQVNDMSYEDLSKPLYAYTKGRELPPHVEFLSLSKVRLLRTEQLKKWKNKREIPFLQYGPDIQGMSSSAFGIFLVKHFRKMFNVTQGRLAASYLPATMFPHMVSYMMNHWITRPIVLTGTQGACEACFEIRNGAYQVVGGFVMPVLTGYFSVMLVSLTGSTYNLPHIFDMKGNAKLFTKQLPKSNALAITCLLQMTIGMCVAYGQLNDFDIFVTKMNQQYHERY